MKDIDYFDYRTCQSDTMMSYIRLAFLEEKQGSKVESEKYMNKATNICQDLQFFKDCSQSKLRQLIEHMDSKFSDSKDFRK